MIPPPLGSIITVKLANVDSRMRGRVLVVNDDGILLEGFHVSIAWDRVGEWWGMSDTAGTLTREQYHAAGFGDDQLIEHGLMIRGV